MPGTSSDCRMLTILANMPVRSQPWISMMGFPIRSSVKMAYITGACSWNRLGPGRSPCAMNAPMRIAALGSPGMPNVRVGIRSAPATALLAASEAATPS